MLMFRPLIRYAVFNGRARRAEYWLFVLFYGFAVGLCLALAFGSLGHAQENPGRAMAGFLAWISLTGLVSLGLTLPYFAVLARRLHDSGRSAWWMLLLLPGYVWPMMLSQSLAGAVSQIEAGAGDAAAGAALLAAAGQSMLIMLVVCLCNFALFVMTLLPGTRGPNRFGPDPRDPHATAGGGSASLYDEDRLDELFAQARKDREGDYKPVFDFSPGASNPGFPQPAARAAEPEPAPVARAVDWGRPAYDPGVAPARPFGRRGA